MMSVLTLFSQKISHIFSSSGLYFIDIVAIVVGTEISNLMLLTTEVYATLQIEL